MMLSLQHTNMNTKSTSDETLSTSMVSEINEEKENIPLCNYCRKSFANYSNLRHHIQIVHLKESKWDCSKCGKVNIFIRKIIFKFFCLFYKRFVRRNQILKFIFVHIFVLNHILANIVNMIVCIIHQSKII